MIASLALAALLPLLATAVPCVQFDTQWNLYAFGGSQDVNLGKSSSWARECLFPFMTVITNRWRWSISSIGRVLRKIVKSRSSGADVLQSPK